MVVERPAAGMLLAEADNRAAGRRAAGIVFESTGRTVGLQPRELLDAQ